MWVRVPRSHCQTSMKVEGRRGEGWVEGGLVVAACLLVMVPVCKVRREGNGGARPKGEEGRQAGTGSQRSTATASVSGRHGGGCAKDWDCSTRGDGGGGRMDGRREGWVHSCVHACVHVQGQTQLMMHASQPASERASMPVQCSARTNECMHADGTGRTVRSMNQPTNQPTRG